MACDVTDAYDEYSKGFVIAMSEFRISGVRGVFEPKSTPTPSSGGVESDVLKLYIFHTFKFFFFCLGATLLDLARGFVLNKWLFTSFFFGFLAVLRCDEKYMQKENKWAIRVFIAVRFSVL
jgi:hypothetical protein